MKTYKFRIISLVLVISFAFMLTTNITYAQDKSIAPIVDNITITNNTGISDSIEIIGLSPGDKVKVYSLASGGILLGAATLSNYDTQTTVVIRQLGIEDGSVYISITGLGESESSRTEVNYTGEPKSIAPDPNNITITNNAGTKDSIEITGLSSSDIVKVYNLLKGGRLLGSAIVSNSNTDTTVNIPQIGAQGGFVYISVTSRWMVESSRIGVKFSTEPMSDKIDPNNIIITNNSKLVDTVEVSGVSASDVIRVYNLQNGGKCLGTATVVGNRTETTVNISQVGINAGSVFVAITNKGMLESDRVEVEYSAEPKSDMLGSEDITITNNPTGTKDSIEVNNVSTGDVVKVYNLKEGGKLLSSAAVTNNKSIVTIYISQIGTSAGNLYVSITSKGKSESERTTCEYVPELISVAPVVANVTVVNNSGIPDTIDIDGLSAGDKVKIYNSETGGKLLGTGVVSTNNTAATITVSQLGSIAGNLYVTTTSIGSNESERKKVGYLPEPKTVEPLIDDIIITNNPTKTADTVEVNSIEATDIVKVYNASVGGKLLGSATVANNNTGVTVSISQIGITEGYIYVTVKAKGEIESSRVKVGYSGEPKSDGLTAGNITVINNASGTADTVEVNGVFPGDVVKVYNLNKNGNILGTATVPNSSTGVTLSISQIGTAAGSLYISVTAKGKLESERIQIGYTTEGKTATLNTDNIIVTNNPVGTADTIQVIGLSDNDIVKVYNLSTLGRLLGSAIVPINGSSATVNYSQLGTTGGSVFVTVTSTGQIESARIEHIYSAENKSNTPTAGNIRITNNAGVADTIAVSLLTPGDKVNIYDLAKGGTLLGSATVSSSNTFATISLTQIGTSSGSLYVSVKSTNKLESERVEAEYLSEAVSDSQKEDYITITNNAGIPDIVDIDNLNANDIIRIYDSSVGGTLLGTATVGAYADSASVSIAQLGTTAGSVYVSVTSKGTKLESNRTQVGYSAEVKTTAPLEGNISIVNNSGVAGTVTVAGLIEKDIINVYDAATKGNLLGTATVQPYGTDATIMISQLGLNAASLYVTVTSRGKLESIRTKAEYSAKAKSSAPNSGNIIITNNVGIPDTVTVSDLVANDVVKVYDASTGGSLLGTATVGINSSQATVSIPRLGTLAGNVYVTVTNSGKIESNRTTVGFLAESASNAPVVGNITVLNSAGSSGTVKISGLVINDVANVYDSATGGNLLGTATLQSSSSKVTITIPELGTSAGSVYISVTSVGKSESKRTKADYSAVSIAPDEGTIVIVNNSGTQDTVTVNSLSSNDVIKVYDSASGGTLIASASVSANNTQVIISITQLTSSAGSVYVSVTKFGKTESERTEANYISEKSSNAPFVGNIDIVNNAGIADTVTVTGISAYDLVKVYSSTSGNTLLGSATVSSSGTQATVTISQLGSAGGNIYVSVTSLGKTESGGTNVDFIAEQSSNSPFAGNITIVNSTGASDTITVTGLLVYDVVKIYDSASGGNLIGSGSIQSNSSQITITITQLSTSGGYVYITVTGNGKLESERTKAGYTVER